MVEMKSPGSRISEFRLGAWRWLGGKWVMRIRAVPGCGCFRIFLACLYWFFFSCFLPGAWAWDYEGHKLINQLALDSLPTNFPAFVFSAAARERIAFLAGEPDRWRSSTEPTLRHANHVDHYFDIDLLSQYRLDPNALSPFRYEFMAQLAAAHSMRPGDFPVIDPAKDNDRNRALIGFLPWAITEYEAKLKVGFSYLKEYEQAGRAEDISNAQANIIYVMGVMGHFVGDGSQPLHSTRHHHGWVGANPEGYATNYSIHSWIDGGYLQQFGVDRERLRARLRPARVLDLRHAGSSSTNLFAAVMSYLEEQHRLVEPLYRLEKAGKLSGRRPLAQDGHDFITGQILKASQALGDLWFTAWLQAPPDLALRSALMKQKASGSSTNSNGVESGK